MKNNKLTRFYIYMATATFIAIMFVIIQKSYNNLMGPIKTAQSSSLTKPMSPKMPSELIDQIQSKKEYLEDAINSSSLPTGMESSLPSEDATPSATP